MFVHGRYWFVILTNWLVGRLVMFYSISNRVDYLMPNPEYTHIYLIYDFLRNSLQVALFLNEQERIFGTQLSGSN